MLLKITCCYNKLQTKGRHALDRNTTLQRPTTTYNAIRDANYPITHIKHFQQKNLSKKLGKNLGTVRAPPWLRPAGTVLVDTRHHNGELPARFGRFSGTVFGRFSAAFLHGFRHYFRWFSALLWSISGTILVVFRHFLVGFPPIFVGFIRQGPGSPGAKMYLFFHCFRNFWLSDGHFLGTFSGGFPALFLGFLALFLWFLALFGRIFNTISAAFLRFFCRISGTFWRVFRTFWRISGTVSEDSKHNSCWAEMSLFGNARQGDALTVPNFVPNFFEKIFWFFFVKRIIFLLAA